MSALSFLQIVGRLPSKVVVAESTLIIIDAQNEYVSGQLKLSAIDESRKLILELLTQYRESGGDVVHVVHATPDGAPVFTPGTKLAEEFEEYAPRPGEKVVTKSFPSSFAGTDLEEYLKGKGRKQIVLVGYMAHVCVSTTARQGAQLGYDVVVVEDAVATRDIPNADAALLKRVALAEIADAFGTVVSRKDIVS